MERGPASKVIGEAVNRFVWLELSRRTYDAVSGQVRCVDGPNISQMNWELGNVTDTVKLRLGGDRRSSLFFVS